MPMNVKPGLWVTAAGFGGGVLFYLLTLYSNTVVFGSLPVWARILPCAVLGAGAALAGVYFITETDPTKAHTLVFAMLCGIVWQPVLDSAVRMAANSTAVSAAQSAQVEASKLSASLPAAAPDQVKEQITPTADKVADSVKLLADGADPHARRELAAATKQGIHSIEAASSKAPRASVAALEKIGKQAIESKQPEVAQAVVDSLHRVKAQESNPLVQANVDDALHSVAKTW